MKKFRVTIISLLILLAMTSVCSAFYGVSNYSYGTLASSIPNAATTGATFTIKLGTYAGAFPSSNFLATITNAGCSILTPSSCSYREIVLISARSGNIFTIATRNMEGTTHSGNWNIGAQITNAITAGTLTELQTVSGLSNVLNIAQAPRTSKYIVQGTSDSGLPNAQFLGSLGTGLLKNITSTGVPVIATPGSDYLVTETDPKISTLTSGKWCTTNGSVVACTTDAPVLTEVDPKIGTLTNTKWCTTNGSIINCTSNSPTTSETDPVVKAIVGIIKSNGTTISAASAGSDYENPLTFNSPLSRGTNAISLGTVGVVNGGTGITSAAVDTVVMGAGTTTPLITLSLPTTGTNGCSGTLDKLLYNTATHAFSCGVDQTSGGGSGITTLNGLTPSTQGFAVGTSGSDFAIVSDTATHTFNLPDASATHRGALTSANWTKFNHAWEEVTTTTKTMVTNGRYIANNASMLAFTVPAALTQGDEFEIAGLGAGSWLVMPNTGQSIVGLSGSSVGTAACNYFIAGTNLYPSIRLLALNSSTLLVLHDGSVPLTSFQSTQDAFTETDGTILSSHTPTDCANSTWNFNSSLSTVNTYIYANRATTALTSGTGTSVYRLNSALFHPYGSTYYNGYIQTDIYFNGTNGANPTYRAGVFLREYLTSADYGYSLTYYNGAYELWKGKVTSGTLLGSYTEAATLGSTHTVKLVASEAIITAYVDGVQRIQVTDTTYNNSYGGIIIINATPTIGYQIDNLITGY